LNSRLAAKRGGTRVRAKNTSRAQQGGKTFRKKGSPFIKKGSHANKRVAKQTQGSRETDTTPTLVSKKKPEEREKLEKGGTKRC